MQEIDSYHTCFVSYNKKCHQPKERAGKCGLDLDTGSHQGCRYAKSWIEGAIEKAGVSGLVHLSVSESGETLRADTEYKYHQVIRGHGYSNLKPLESKPEVIEDYTI